MDCLLYIFFRQNNIFWNTMMLDRGYRTLRWCCRWVKKSLGIWWENGGRFPSFCVIWIYATMVCLWFGLLRYFNCPFVVEVVFGLLAVDSWLPGYDDGALLFITGWWDWSCACGGSSRCHRLYIAGCKWSIWGVRAISCTRDVRLSPRPQGLSGFLSDLFVFCRT